MREEVKLVKECILARDRERIEELVKRALDAGISVEEVLNSGLIAAMEEVGRLFSEGKVYVPEMMLSAMIMKRGLAVLRPLIVSGGKSERGTVVLGTVKGDIHDIGKNLVGMMLEGAGYKVIDLGIDQAPEAFIDGVRKHRPRFVGMSALLSTTMHEMPKVIDALKGAEMRDFVKVVIGGAAVNEAFAAKISADGYAKDAAEAVRLLRTLD